MLAGVLGCWEQAGFLAGLLGVNGVAGVLVLAGVLARVLGCWWGC